MVLKTFLHLGQRLQKLLVISSAHTDDRRGYKQKFESGSFEREPREFWQGVRARLDGKPRESCPYRFEKAESWHKGFDGRR